MVVIRGRYHVIAGAPSIIGVMDETREGLELLLDDPPNLDGKLVDEMELIQHMQDTHGWDFLTIARKLVKEDRRP